MKRVCLCLCAVFLSSCSLSGKELPATWQPGEISVALPNEGYAKGLSQLWAIRYPQYKDALRFEVTDDSSGEAFTDDIEWIDDASAMKRLKQAFKFTQEGYAVPKQLKRKQLAGYFQPIQAKGYLFAYDEYQLEKLGMQTEELHSFEEISKKGKGSYYYVHANELMLPLWIGTLSSKHTQKQPFETASLQSAIASFQSLYQTMSLNDEILLDMAQFNQRYAFGLVNPQLFIESKAYQEGKLHFAKMPTYEGESLSPLAQVYGFMADQSCAYPEIIQAFMEMVRSKEGLQVFLDTKENIAVIRTEDLSAFTVFDARRKEMIRAVNDSMLWDLTSIKDRPEIDMKSIYALGEPMSILQNGICAGKSSEQIAEELNTTIAAWLKK